MQNNTYSITAIGPYSFKFCFVCESLTIADEMKSLVFVLRIAADAKDTCGAFAAPVAPVVFVRAVTEVTRMSFFYYQ